MSLTIDAGVGEAYASLRDGDIDFVIAGYDGLPTLSGSNTLVVAETGNGSIDDMAWELSDGKIQYVAMNVVDAQSNLPKVVFITSCTDSVPDQLKSLVNLHQEEVGRAFPGYHVQINARSEDDLDSETIVAAVAKAAGVFYSSHGEGLDAHTSTGKQAALQSYKDIEGEGNLDGVVYETSALPSVTPVDLNVRNYVAPPSEARKNMADNVLDRNKFSGSGGAPAEATAAAAVGPGDDEDGGDVYEGEDYDGEDFDGEDFDGEDYEGEGGDGDDA